MNTYAEPMRLLKSAAVMERFLALNTAWDASPLERYHEDLSVDLAALLDGLHSCNAFSWMVDDLSRGNYDDTVLMNHKRNLDASNFMRSAFMEQIDATVVGVFDLKPREAFDGLDVNSETVGQMIDRLSVLSLKQHNVPEQLSPDAAAHAKTRLNSQLHYVSHCLDRFLDSLAAGTGHMLAYKQFKTYRSG